jgi:hypothetical protein
MACWNHYSNGKEIIGAVQVAQIVAPDTLVQGSLWWHELNLFDFWILHKTVNKHLAEGKH